MFTKTLTIASLQITLGITAYLLSGKASPTALIPSLLGSLMLLLALLSLKPSLSKFASISSFLLNLLALPPCSKGLFNSFLLLSGHSIPRPQAALSQALMALLCLSFLSLSLLSYLKKRHLSSSPYTLSHK